MKSILLVDDEPVISNELQRVLQRFGYRIELAHTVETALQMAEQSKFDVILVDLKLRSEHSDRPSGANGTGLVRQMRAARVNVPILMFTVMDDELYETAALDAGADEYILKTVSIPRLLSRLQANLRRHERDTGKTPLRARWVGIGEFKLDREDRVLAAGPKQIELTIRETKVLEILAQNPAKVFSGQELLDRAWGDDLRKSSAALEGVLCRLRQKFRNENIQDLIENVRGQGYKLVSPKLPLPA